MTQHDSGSWLEALINEAQESRWCTRPFCTTCGCSKFRLALWGEAMLQAGAGSERPQSSPDLRYRLNALSQSERARTVGAVIAGLRQLPEDCCDTDAIQTILVELYPLLLRHGVGLSLETELSGTRAGRCLARMIAHEQAVQKARNQHEAYESPEAVKERVRVRKAEKAQAHSLRQSQGQARAAARQELLAALGRLSASDRLVRFAVDSLLNIDSVSHDLIPVESGVVSSLDRATALTLLARVGQRKGAWDGLRRALETQLSAGSV
jgi:hypothetical protein